MKSPRRLCLAAIAVVMTLANLASAQILNQVPKEAMVVIKVSNLAATSQKLSRLANELGVAQMAQELADPLGSLEKELGITKGLNRDGELAVVLLDPAVAGEDASIDEALLLLIPVSDYNAFLTNFEEPREEDGLHIVNMFGPTDPMYSAQWGSYAALSPSKAVAQLKPAGLTLNGVAAKEFETKDAIVIANFATIRAKALPELTSNREMVLQEISDAIEKDGGEKGKKFEPVIKAVVNQAMDYAAKFLNETDAATFGLSIGEDGISTTLMAEFQPDSYFGQKTAAVKNNNATAMTGLPGSTYLYFGGVHSTGDVTNQLITDFLEPILPTLEALGDEGKPFLEYVDSIKQINANTESAAFAIVAPTAALGQGSLLQYVLVCTGNANAIREAQAKGLTSSETVFRDLGLQQGTEPTVHTAEALTIDGVKLDQYQTPLMAQPKTRQEMQIVSFLSMMMGPNGMNMYVGSVDDRHSVMFSGTPQEFMQQTIAAVKANSTEMSSNPEVQDVAAHLPANRLGELYVAVDNIVATVVRYAKQNGIPVQLQLPPNLPPIGNAVSTEGSAVRVDTYVPNQLIQSLIAAGMQMMGAMQGGGMGGPDGL